LTVRDVTRFSAESASSTVWSPGTCSHRPVSESHREKARGSRGRVTVVCSCGCRWTLAKPTSRLVCTPTATTTDGDVDDDPPDRDPDSPTPPDRALAANTAPRCLMGRPRCDLRIAGSGQARARADGAANANGWDTGAWNAAPRVFVDQTPVVGAIAQWNAGSAGHIAYVEAVTSSYIETSTDSYEAAWPLAPPLQTRARRAVVRSSWAGTDPGRSGLRHGPSASAASLDGCQGRRPQNADLPEVSAEGRRRCRSVQEAAQRPAH
jgi:CHAP domain